MIFSKYVVKHINFLLLYALFIVILQPKYANGTKYVISFTCFGSI